MATITNGQAIERLRKSKADFIESVTHPHGDPALTMYFDVDGPADEVGHFLDLAACGHIWAENEASFRQLQLLDLMVSRAAVQPLPLDGPDPAGRIMEILGIEDDEVDGYSIEGRPPITKRDMLFDTVTTGGHASRACVEAWIAGALTFWRAIKDAL